jgi:hypothetical protein
VGFFEIAKNENVKFVGANVYYKGNSGKKTIECLTAPVTADTIHLASKLDTGDCRFKPFHFDLLK